MTCVVGGCNGAQLAGSCVFCERHKLAWLQSGEQKRHNEIADLDEPRSVERCVVAVMDFARRIEAEERNAK